ncbi:hypothetical protein COL516b_007908 [Colletotrichum fioriniae]|nr:uncharacterized protein COL516b_007908 [Colletotrichum fioriniae]KAJ0301135.1 hypothetical protein COL516b_007908 [Colletotrichum fioriniae]
MASLQDIMNVDEDQLESHTIKNDQVPAPSGRHHQPYLAPSAVYNTGYATGGDQADRSSTPQGTKRSSSSRTSKSNTTGSSSSSARPVNTRRRSNVSTDSMEQPNYGYGHAGSSSGGHDPSGQPMRPFGSVPPGGEVPVKLTPITGRVSRAKKVSELEGDKASRSRGGSQSRRTSAASLDAGVRSMGLQPPLLGYPTSATTPIHGLPMTSSMSHPGTYQSMSGSDVSKSMSPHLGNDSYRPSSGGPGYGGGYSLSGQSSQQPILQPSNGDFNTPPSFSSIDYQPRTTPEYPPLYLQTSGLGLQTPELSHAQDPMGWPSSASDSTYSTPSDNSRRAFWPTAGPEWQNNLLSPCPTGGYETIGATGPMLYQYSTSPQLSNPQVYPMLGTSIPTYSDEQTFRDHQQQPRFPNTVRSLTPPVTSASAQSCETLVTPSTALPSDRMMNSYACLGRKEVASGLLAAPALMQGSLPMSICRAIPGYLDVYWERFHPHFPIVHRRTFEAAAEQCEVLRCAMAAVATQYLSGKEDRIRGDQLHEYAWQQSRYFPQWDVSVMQAILLCEYFARFRGRRAAIRPSKEFESVYSRVYNDKAVIFGAVPRTGTNTVRWHSWLDAEARRRLLSACFVLDIHSSVYLAQPRVRNFDITADGMPPNIPLTGPAQDLWDAPSADTWAAMVSSKRVSLDDQTLLSLINPDTLSRSTVDTHAPFDRAVILAFETFRMANIFSDCSKANTYLALHHTPLHDLLAVSGDSWIFSHKVLQPKQFDEHKRRLREWSDSGSAAVALVFACRALRAFTDHGNSEEDSDDEDGMDTREAGRPRMWKDISDYWGMYVCALICWANGHRINGGEASRSDSDNDDEALQWIRTFASMGAKNAIETPLKKEATMVVALVRRWLEVDCLGNRSRLYVDAVGVLSKLAEGCTWKWF